ncbi:hypothetical protein B0I37DRAFT_435180 [Chaetomium sp. MPI-CAGE-AT-0009]|nr:hypothetical protein B0I37DRAFT_435180 [Chaetomium sp. MPI-CAGE-AT-0009]
MGSYLGRLIRSWPQKAPDGPTRLPLEVWLMVLSHLPLESVMAFALTSRRFYTQFMPPRSRQRPDDTETRRAFLSLLEKDTPHLYLCHKCLDLHTWAEYFRRGGIAWYDKHCRNWNRFKGYSLGHEPYELDFHIVQLVMNRHFYGEGHGPPLDTLSYTAKRDEVRDCNHGVVVDQSWRAQIIDDELYLETNMQGELWTYNLVCDHIGLRVDRPSIPGLQRNQEGYHDEFASVTNMLLSCGTCCTDYLCNVKRHPTDSRGLKGWVISLTKWHRMGDCRYSTATRGWGTYPGYDCLPQRRDGSSKAGEVFRKWTIQDDQYPAGTADIVGYWAENIIMGGVVVFDRSQVWANGYTPEPRVYLHSDRNGVTIRVWQLLGEQQEALVNFLLSIGTCPFPLRASDRNLTRFDPDKATLNKVYRDVWERSPPRQVRGRGGGFMECVQSELDYPRVREAHVGWYEKGVR